MKQWIINKQNLLCPNVRVMLISLLTYAVVGLLVLLPAFQ